MKPAVWLAVAIGIGAAIGAATDNMGTWVAVGAGVGAATMFVLAKRPSPPGPS